MSQTLYLDCQSGISGDMTVAALLDLGADPKVLVHALSSLPVDGYEVKISRVVKSGLDACDFAVILDRDHENHDHDMDYLHGHDHHHHDHHRGHDDDHHQHNGDHHQHDSHSHDHHDHVHRGMPEIINIINQGQLTPNARTLAIKIFEIIAQAESKAHGLPADQVHFHEVGAVDSIIDIVAVAVCLDNLQITNTIIPQLNEGKGCIRCQHGLLPVPVPAVANIIQDSHLSLHIMDVEGEFVTPTGAAIAAAIQTASRLPDSFKILKTGYGAGKRNYERPSLLRAMLIEIPSEKEKTADDQDIIYKLETNIDDCSGEALGLVMDLLLQAGARDVHYIPVFMKKNRPAYQLNVICDKAHVQTMEQLIFQNTTTIGIRRMAMERTVLPREIQTVETAWGPVQVKLCRINQGLRCYPEYDSICSVCQKQKVSYMEVYQAAVRAGEALL